MVITNFQQLKSFRNKSGIYIFINKKDPTKKYVGKTKRCLYKRIAIEHNQANHTQCLHQAIKEVGLLEGFTIELIHWWDGPIDNLEILALETAIIDEYKCLKKFGGYNTCLFGSDRTGIPLSKEHKNHISNALKGKAPSLETRQKMKLNRPDVSGENNPMFGKRLTGQANHNFDLRIFHFFNKVTNETFKGHQNDFIKKFNLNAACVCYLIQQKRSIHKNWVLMT